MPTLLGDPIAWSAQIVATRPRFWFIVIAMVPLPFELVYVAAKGPWHAAVVCAAGIAWVQFLVLFALRSLYLQIRGQ
jgi:hypothetical protein